MRKLCLSIPFVFLSFFLFSCKTSDNASGLDAAKEPLSPNSYSEVAKVRIQDSFEAVKKDLGKFKSNSLPHDLKATRKSVGKLRDMLDIFVHVFPDDGEEDQFFQIRKQLDVGYETIGYFKDLYDMQGVKTPAEAKYDDSEVKELRDPAFAWRNKFMDESNLAGISSYFKSLKGRKPAVRKSKKLSKFYWANVEFVPDLAAPASLGMKGFVNALTKVADVDAKKTLTIENILDLEQIESFHDTRKRIRAILEICEYFPEIFNEQSRAFSYMKIWDELVGLYGDLHDKMIVWEKAEKKGNQEKANALAVEIKKGWEDIKVWQVKNLRLEGDFTQ